MQKISYQRVFLSLGFTAVLVIGLAVLPWPFSPKAVGVVAFANEHSIRAGSDGFVIEINAFDGLGLDCDWADDQNNINGSCP